MHSPTSTQPTRQNWMQAMTLLASRMEQRGVHASRCVVLVPYVQLMQEAKTAWTAFSASTGKAASFMPQFHSSQSWADSLSASAGGFLPSGDDIRGDAAVDLLTATALLVRIKLGAGHPALAARVLESAWSLGRVAAAQTPDARLEWGTRLSLELDAGMDTSALAFELAIARVALAWASSSSYPTDVLFTAQAAATFDLLLVLEGFQFEPLTETLKSRLGDRVLSIPLMAPSGPGALSLHEAEDAEDEAQRAAACVMTHLSAGRTPVALIAQDRLLTRRARALLAGRGVSMRDETGWKLSTTRAAATLMSLLRAVPWDASTDAMLDWLKNAPTFDAQLVTGLEAVLRRLGVRLWRGVPAGHPAIEPLARQLAPLREAMQKSRTLAGWLAGLRVALQSAGQWQPLATDAAGIAVIEALRLERFDQPNAGDVELLSARMSLQDFTSWVNHALESANFLPEHPAQAQVVILPLSQLLGRPMQAVVLPGADEVRLAVSPEPPGIWTPAQRAVLGLPLRSEMAASQRAAWQYSLGMPHLDVLWRTSEAGEALMPSGFVQELELQQTLPKAVDPRATRQVTVKPTPIPAPTGQALPVTRLSASAYEDLRRCPYRFFALRQLGLQEPEELESELGKREFGNWLHALLHHFHHALKAAPALDLPARVAMINIAAGQARAELGLLDSEFLPFAAIWPRVRDGYLEWLAGHEASGAFFDEGEVWTEMPLGEITLVGKLDRMDRFPDGSRLVIDYKTESPGKTSERIKNGGEDTQLAFYAALMEDDTLAAAYVNLGEKEATKTYLQNDIVNLRDQLIDSVLTDMARIKMAAPLPALGEGNACEYCAARGLCRKDFWS